MLHVVAWVLRIGLTDSLPSPEELQLEMIQASYSLSPTQHGMLFDRLFGEHPGVHIEQVQCSLREPLDVDAFHRAWLKVFARHSALRTTFRWEGLDEPLQDVHDSIAVPLQQQDWREFSATQQEERLGGYLREDRLRGFDLSQSPLIRLALFRLGEERYSLVWTFFHGLIDGRSFPLTLNEVFAFYEAELRGEELSEESPVPYQRFVEWSRELDWTAAETFWRQKLKGFSAPTPILHAITPGSMSEEESHHGEQEIELSVDVTRQLKGLAEENGVTLNTLFQGAWALLLSAYSGEEDVLFGSLRACRRSSIPGSEDVLGVFINTLPFRVTVAPETSLSSWLKGIRDQQVAIREYEHTPLVEVQQWSEVGAGTALFESLLIFDNSLLGPTLREQGGSWQNRDFILHDQTNYPLTIRGHYYGANEPRLLLNIRFYRDRFSDETIQRMLASLESILRSMASNGEEKLASVSVLSRTERDRLILEWNDTATEYPREKCIHQLFEEQVERTPDHVALVFEAQHLTYSELNDRANRLARHLRSLGVSADQRVGICVMRSVEMVVGILGILKAGGAYVPLDPEYPAERLAFMLADSGAPVLVTEQQVSERIVGHGAQEVVLDRDWPKIENEEGENVPGDTLPANLAYVIYTSGSTGKPKGVMVEHRNVVNFFAGMDARLTYKPGEAWLAVTSLSFDISVLELLFTLSRGFKVVLHADETRASSRNVGLRPATSSKTIDFSLSYFASYSGREDEVQDKYRLLLEGAKFADQHDFLAIWTPERHFHEFGGLYPSPAVVSAAIAATTNHLQIRAGSVVLPLWDPLRVAEEWSVVDNLSNGRVGISIASGWQPNDFVLAPENYADRKEVMFRGVETVQKLWSGQSVTLPDGNQNLVDVSILPKPVQSELPIWVTAAGSPETVKKAGEIGANVLTHLLGQTVEELGEKLAVYRKAWRENGHAGEGHVTLMLHTFVGTDKDAVRELVRGPMKAYLKTAVGLVKKAAWYWPTSVKTTETSANELDDAFNSLSDEDRDALLEHAFERYFSTGGLFGTPTDCLQLVEQLKQTGVDEIACLIDFGVDSDAVLESLSNLDTLRQLANQNVDGSGEDYSLPSLIKEHNVSHLQCTPSMMTLLTANEENHEALRALRHLYIGGEAFPVNLASRLSELTSASVENMYGPTETTIWSTTFALPSNNGSISIGRPIANTTIYIVDSQLNPVPIGVPGELLIGGDGVTRGYEGREELTAERFVHDPFSDDSQARLYRTGDMARYDADGNIVFLGRFDHQVKVRGHRIELGEIETVLSARDDIRESVVLARNDASGDQRLVAYFVPEGDPVSERDPVGDHTPSSSELRDDLRQKLPDYMIPTNLIALPKFPLTPNGKVDRKALPAPSEVKSERAPASQVPGSELERAIAAIWKDLLSVTDVGIQDNFFDIGGHSLLAVQVHSRLRKGLGKDLSMTDLFRFPTIRSLATHLGDDSKSEKATVKSRDRADLRRDAIARRQQVRNRGRPNGGAKELADNKF